MIIKILDETIIDKPNQNNYGFVYITHNLISNKYYIGKCKYSRRNSWETYLGSGKYLKNAINKYGIENFKKYIIKECKTEKELIESEEYYLEKYKAYEYGNNFYNISNTGSGGYLLSGYSEEQKQQYSKKMSNIMKEKSKDPNYIKNISLGVKKSFQKEETKTNLSKGQLNRFSKKEERDKISIHLKERWKDKEFRKRYSENNCKKVYMLNDNKEIVKTFQSIGKALEYLNLKSHTTLLKSIRTGTKYKNYYWKR